MMGDVFQTLIDARERGEPVALATVVEIQGSVPGSESLKMVVDAHGRRLAGTVGGGCIEAEVLGEASAVIANERPRLVNYRLTEEETGIDGLICGGTVRIFIEPIVAPTCVVFGGGHISSSIAPIARLAGFRVIVIDDREAFANRTRFPSNVADQVIAAPFVEAAQALPVGRNHYLVIVTRGHAFDREVLQWAVTTSARYIGMIGSRRKVLETYRQLIAEGVAPTVLQRVQAPIGLDIGAVTQEEIAVAVVAELVFERRRGYRPERKGVRRPDPLQLDELEAMA
jgi:xanthine dehydrogenase accessory factor